MWITLWCNEEKVEWRKGKRNVWTSIKHTTIRNVRKHELQHKLSQRNTKLPVGRKTEIGKDGSANEMYSATPVTSDLLVVYIHVTKERLCKAQDDPFGGG